MLPASCSLRDSRSSRSFCSRAFSPAKWDGSARAFLAGRTVSALLGENLDYLRNFRCAILFWIRLRSSGSVTSDQSSPLEWCLEDEEDPCLLEELEDEWW